MTTNLAAFLAMLRHSEGTAKHPDPYRVCFGENHTIADLSDHPAITGEWMGEPLPDAMCIAAGLRPPCKSTAAGAYQLTKHTWAAARGTLLLPDFTASNQDDAAILLMKQKNALIMVNEGRVADAIDACRNIWASLPGNPANQPQGKLADLIDVYRSQGGGYA